jgi:hypothetical protein
MFNNDNFNIMAAPAVDILHALNGEKETASQASRP